MKYIYSTSQMSKLSLTLRTFSVTSSVAGLFLTLIEQEKFYSDLLLSSIQLVKSLRKLLVKDFNSIWFPTTSFTPVNWVVKNVRSRLKLFLFSFLISIFRTRARVRVTKSRCHTAGHIRWHSHKLHDTWKDVEHSGRDDVIQCVDHMLILRHTHGHLG